MSYKTNERLSSVKITDDDILKIIAKLDANKAHDHDKISIRRPVEMKKNLGREGGGAVTLSKNIG